MNDVQELIRRKQAGIQRMLLRQKIIHTKMASLIENNPDLIANAIKRVEQKLVIAGSATRAIYTEWHQILQTWSRERIVALLRSEDLQFEQLRACAPFTFENQSQAT